MSNELQTDYLAGKTVYFLLRNSVGQIWNGANFVAYATADYANYDIAAVEQGTASGYYVADFPSIAAGVYYSVAKERAGGVPVETDISIGWGNIDWGGTGPFVLASGTVYLASGHPTTLYSGQIAQVYSGNLSGQQVNLLSGNEVAVVSGTRVNTWSGQVYVASGSFSTSGLVLSIFTYNVSGIVSGTIPPISLGSVVLKHTSRFNARSGYTYLPDGTSIHMLQVPVNGSGMFPIGELGVGQ